LSTHSYSIAGKGGKGGKKSTGLGPHTLLLYQGQGGRKNQSFHDESGHVKFGPAQTKKGGKGKGSWGRRKDGPASRRLPNCFRLFARKPEARKKEAEGEKRERKISLALWHLSRLKCRPDFASGLKGINRRTRGKKELGKRKKKNRLNSDTSPQGKKKGRGEVLFYFSF